MKFLILGSLLAALVAGPVSAQYGCGHYASPYITQAPTYYVNRVVAFYPSILPYYAATYAGDGTAVDPNKAELDTLKKEFQLFKDRLSAVPTQVETRTKESNSDPDTEIQWTPAQRKLEASVQSKLSKARFVSIIKEERGCVSCHDSKQAAKKGGGFALFANGKRRVLDANENIVVIGKLAKREMPPGNKLKDAQYITLISHYSTPQVTQVSR